MTDIAPIFPRIKSIVPLSTPMDVIFIEYCGQESDSYTNHRILRFPVMGVCLTATGLDYLINDPEGYTPRPLGHWLSELSYDQYIVDVVERGQNPTPAAMRDAWWKLLLRVEEMEMA